MRLRLRSLVALYGLLAFVDLRLKLVTTPAWFSGVLEQAQAELMARAGTNNMQSRLLGFLIPQALVSGLGMSVSHAYMIQHYVCVGATLVAFHLYLRRWFVDTLCLAGTSFFAAILPITYRNDLQEATNLLLLTFVAGLAAIRDRRYALVGVVVFLGVLNNETVLALAPLLFLHEVMLRGSKRIPVATGLTFACFAPGAATFALVRYVMRDRPTNGGQWHFRENIAGIAKQITVSPIDWPRAPYLHFALMFGALWYYAFAKFKTKPEFVRASMVLVPSLVVPQFVAGIVGEPRLMAPLGFVLLPAALFAVFAGDRGALVQDEAAESRV